MFLPVPESSTESSKQPQSNHLLNHPKTTSSIESSTESHQSPESSTESSKTQPQHPNHPSNHNPII